MRSWCRPSSARDRRRLRSSRSSIGPEVIAPWLHEIRDPGWDGGPAERAEQAYAEMRRMAPDDRWHGLEGGESVRDFVDRIHNGAEYFLAERSVSRDDHELPVWTISEPGDASCCSLTPERTR